MRTPRTLSPGQRLPGNTPSHSRGAPADTTLGNMPARPSATVDPETEAAWKVMRGLLLGTLVIIGGACAYGAYVYANKPKHQYASRSSAKSAGQTWAGIGSWFSGSSRDQGPSSFLDGQCKAAAFGTAFAAFTGKKPTKSAAEVERECRQIGRDVETAFSEMNRQLSSRPWRN